MSIGEFTETLQTRIIQQYYRGEAGLDARVALGSKGTGTMGSMYSTVVDAKKFRGAFTSGKSHDSIITRDGLNSLMDSLNSTDIDSKAVRSLAEKLVESLDFDAFAAWLTNRVTKTGTSVKLIEGGLKLQDIPQENTKKYFVEYITEVLDTSSFAATNTQKTKAALIAHISENIQAGHLAGIFSLKFKVALGFDVTSTSKDSEWKNYRDFTISFKPGISSDVPEAANLEKNFNVLLKAFLDADYLTSNVVDRQEIFMVAVKYALGDEPRLQTEMQFKTDNEASGRLLTVAGKHINDLIKSLGAGKVGGDAQRSTQNLVASLQNLHDVIVARAEELKNVNEESAKLAEEILTNAKTLSALIKSPGSVSILKGIGKSIVSAIAFGKVPKQQKTTAKIVSKKSKKDPVSASINKAIKNTIPHIKKAKQDLAKQAVSIRVKRPQLRARNGQFYSIALLQDLLDSLLVETVKRNMGDGSRRDILNLRTGRLAESVKVERLSQSRAGMITAFYTYMKYPYATFSENGRQEYPRTRDPKLLISKSIREVAALRVANRLRSVSL